MSTDTNMNWEKINIGCHWHPKEDITVYELAQILPILLFAYRFPIEAMQFVNNLPKNLKRHFEVAK